MHGTMYSARTILIVESNHLLGLLTADILQAAGFATIQAENADEAWAILESRSDIALLLTAVKMAVSMNGTKLAHAVHARWPTMKIIVASGRRREPEDELPAGSRFFLKPYDADTMISEVHSLTGL